MIIIVLKTQKLKKKPLEKQMQILYLKYLLLNEINFVLIKYDTFFLIYFF
jgi:hypothetical protein